MNQPCLRVDFQTILNYWLSDLFYTRNKELYLLFDVNRLLENSELGHTLDKQEIATRLKSL